ncbi:response regulator receiver modulated diguanylate cyclase [Thalassoporum mexicanum PCC 7367]|uniref:response regulator n=1 Tax=Thalassoporum mexicanum TaxID=3457544 RepID=UPI00029FDBFA|nr:response regulator [Pseudanabaena sp. PCC 7367]AFY70201.1 response regulator receiver modulated diguanylate cyclase [Pseudanabaena sp. PCC 7367]
MRILVIDVDEQIVTSITEVLSQHRHLVDSASDFNQGWDQIQAFEYDLLILSFTLAEQSSQLGELGKSCESSKSEGLRLCQRLRQEKYQMPILMLGNQNDAIVAAQALDAGADDYLAQPFEWPEFLARFRALLRRNSTTVTPTLQWGQLELDPISCKVTYIEAPVNLRPREYKLLELFMRNRNRIFSCGAILDRLWSFDDPPGEETIRAHIKGLRQKLRAVGAADLIETVYGLGYRLRAIEKSDPALADPKTAEVVQIKMIPSLQQALSRTWERIKPTIINKLASFEQALQAIESGDLDRQICRETQADVQELANLLIAFQAEKATKIANQISDFFGDQLVESNNGQVQITQKQDININQLMIDLRQELDRIDLVDRHAEVGHGATDSTSTDCCGDDENAQEPDTRSRLYLVESDAELVEKLLWEATIRDINLEAFPDTNAARRAIEQQWPDILLLNPNCSRSVEDGLTLLTELTNLTPAIPVVVISEQGDIDTRLEAMRLGCRAFIQKPSLPDHTIEVIVQILQETEDCLAKVLAVNGDQKSLGILRALMEPWGMQLTTLSNPLHFWEVLEKVSPDLLLLDLEMPHINGFELCQLVRNAPRWSGLPIIFLSKQTQTSTLRQMFSAGADDFVSKPIAGPELITRIFNRIERNQLFRRLAERDSLTQLPNRAKFSLHLKRLLGIAEQRGKVVDIGMIAINELGQINQQFGFAIGDAIIRQSAELLKRYFCNEDMVGRWSGRKFIVSMYDMEPGIGRKRIEEAVFALKNKPFVTTERKKFHTDFSGGLASFPADGENLESLSAIAEADLHQSRVKSRDAKQPSQIAAT